jgi:hypothetical protein
MVQIMTGLGEQLCVFTTKETPRQILYGGTGSSLTVQVGTVWKYRLTVRVGSVWKYRSSFTVLLGTGTVWKYR